MVDAHLQGQAEELLVAPSCVALPTTNEARPDPLGEIVAKKPSRRKRESKVARQRALVSWGYASDQEAGSTVPPVLRWRSAVFSERGPASPTTRLVLAALSHHMNTQGGSCFPSYERLAKETGLSKRVIVRHMNLAHAEGWFDRTARMGYAKGWRQYEYQATIPRFE